MDISSTRKNELLNRMKQHPLLENKTSRVKGCIYGPNGVGKTVAAVGLLRKLVGPDKLIVFVDTNEGYESLRNHGSLIKNVLPIPYESAEQLHVIAEAVYKNIEPFTNVGGIVLDDADFMANQELISLWHSRDPSSKSDPEKPDRPEYLKLGFRFTELMDYIFKMTPDVHLMMTAHDGSIKSKDGAVVLKVIPGFNPALAKEVAGRLQFIVSMTAKITNSADKENAQYTRLVQVHPTSMVDCKTRVGCNKIMYEISDFINHVTEWSHSGKPEDDEKTALLTEIKTSKITTPLDELAKAAGILDEADELPVIVQ